QSPPVARRLRVVLEPARRIPSALGPAGGRMTTNVRLSTITGSAPCALRRGWSAPALLLLLVACVGCTPRESLDTAYGKTGGTPGGKSVNGLSVLADMYEAAGCEVYTTNRFSPRLSQADTIVWAPDDFEPPSAEHREYLE